MSLLNNKNLPTSTACGIIIYHVNPNGVRHYLILRYTAGHWDFANGQTEPDETIQQTALREVYEETGLIPTIHRDFIYSYDYVCFNKHHQEFFKTVQLLVGSTDQTNVILSQEHTDYAWLALEQACAQLSYENARQALQNADLFVSSLA